MFQLWFWPGISPICITNLYPSITLIYRHHPATSVLIIRAFSDLVCPGRAALQRRVNHAPIFFGFWIPLHLQRNPKPISGDATEREPEGSLYQVTAKAKLLDTDDRVDWTRLVRFSTSSRQYSRSNGKFSRRTFGLLRPAGKLLRRTLGIQLLQVLRRRLFRQSRRSRIFRGRFFGWRGTPLGRRRSRRWCRRRRRSRQIARRSPPGLT